MLLDIYVLASPSPTLYVYPSGRHVAPRGGVSTLPGPHRPLEPVVYRDRGRLSFRIQAIGTARRLRASGAAGVQVRAMVRPRDWHHLTPSWLLLDALLDDWQGEA